MAIKFEDIKKYYDTMEKHYGTALGILNDAILEKKAKLNMPIYSTKFRVKNINSVYLKTKRKEYASLDEITDYGGLRILCLFEQDIPDIHNVLLSLMKSEGFDLIDFKIFNWTDSLANKSLISAVGKLFGGISGVEVTTKESGYKSLHYIASFPIGLRKIIIEIQLRTLLQDTWGELEHSLSYKQGNIHPHIKKSFQLLARDLQTNDCLMSHLKDVSDKERAGDFFTLSSTGPQQFFDYESELIPTILEGEPTATVFQKYMEFMADIDPRYDKKDKLDAALKLYADLDNKISGATRNDPKVDYFLKMEKAYLLFWESDVDKAFQIYEEIAIANPDHYVVHFRKGEIYLTKNKTEDALKAFDLCEDLLPISGAEVINKYRISVKVANIYWMLGQEYLKLSLNLINDAHDIIESNPKMFRPIDKFKLINNICWYNLDHYISTRSNESWAEASKWYEALVESPEAETPWSANTYDTVAWFLYWRYKKESDPADAIKAQEYCRLIGKRENHSFSHILSWNVQRNHISQIMSLKT